MATIPDEDLAEMDNDQFDGIDEFEPDVLVSQPDTTEPDSTDSIGTAGNSDSAFGESDNNEGSDGIVIVEEDATYDGTPPTSTNNPTTRNNNAETGTASIQAAKPAATYILQINSFSDADEADRRRAQVLMAGVDARVIKNTTGNGLPIYQVISRPLNNRQAVTTAQQRLQNNGIDSIIVEQRR